MPKVTQLVSSGVGVQTQVCLTSKCMLEITNMLLKNTGQERNDLPICTDATPTQF